MLFCEWNSLCASPRCRDWKEWNSLCASPRCRERPCNKIMKVETQMNLVSTFIILLRKEWDSNPRYDKNRTPDFESGPFDHSGIFP